MKLDRATEALARDDGYSGYYAFANSALIIFREGLEAALILASIIGMLRVMGATEAIRYIHLGWILALFCGGLTWIATQTVLTLSGRHRESMEGFISVFAAVALFYVGYWLHTRSEVKRWHEFIEQKVKSGISTQRIFGLTGISFFAVYREAFELVLFYQALWMQNENNHGSILWGLALGLGLLGVATFAILKLGLKLPLKYFLSATGTLLYVMAFIFAGNGVKELQAAQWMSTTPTSVPHAIPMLGIYPTVETLAAQGIDALCLRRDILLAGPTTQEGGVNGFTADPKNIAKSPLQQSQTTRCAAAAAAYWRGWSPTGLNSNAAVASAR